MGRVDQLVAAYTRHVSLPLRLDLPLSQRVWFVVYPPEEERRLASRLGEFEIATKNANLGWRQIDLTGIFADWMDTFEDDERQLCLGNPEILESYADPSFKNFICDRISAAVRESSEAPASQTVFAVTGLVELYDFVHVSTVVDGIDSAFPGILLLFFPGDREGNTYSFLGARAGWNYLALPILAES